MNLMGIEIVVSKFIPEKQPVLQIREDCPMTDAFRSEINKYLIDTFGLVAVVYVMNGKIHTNPKNLAVIRQKYEERRL